MAAAPTAVTCRVRAARTSRRAAKPSLNFMGRLPSEILFKILSYLDASALHSISHVNKLFSQLANDNALWRKIHMAALRRTKKRKAKHMDELLLQTATVELQGRPAGFWKCLHFKAALTYDMNKCKSHLALVSRHTGLPSRTERVLRDLHVTWEVTVSDQSGRDGRHELSWSQFCETSVSLCWSAGGCSPNYKQISTLQLHGVRRIALNCPGLKIPGWRSLMVKVDVQALTECVQVIGQDRMVVLKLLQPGVLIGVWRDQCSVAFVMFTLHFHRLVERSTQGESLRTYVEPIIKPPFDDIDPEYGLHGYQLHIVLHDTACEIMSESFPELFCRRTQISDGLIQLTAISRTTPSQHAALSGSISLPWRCEALQGTVENCCIMSLTLLDEFKNPFWCVGSPVAMALQTTPVSYDYDGEHFLIHYQDSDGRVKMELVKEQKQFLLISLVVFVTVCKVNKHFSKDY
ncbi:F-box only protein 15 isoform X2 [Cottoperca gobio]|uniref:F-box only protein 15 isoform X2 n=1 Tax=Cottoperca gobio TaxID=56716 RepID=A0A6J2RWF3_COTGO|nr:F-box only protein 15 isoform X2 [Cottoperca gobio]